MMDNEVTNLPIPLELLVSSELGLAGATGSQ